MAAQAPAVGVGVTVGVAEGLADGPAVGVAEGVPDGVSAVSREYRSRVGDPVPAFVSSGTWKTYVDDRHTMVTLPLPDSSYPDPLRWTAYTGQDLRIASAYALLPKVNHRVAACIRSPRASL